MSFNQKEINWKLLFDFIYETGKIVDLQFYSYNFLKKLNNIIPFYGANFFLFDENEDLLQDPICFNISKLALNSYNDYYHKLDDIRKIAFNQVEPIRSTDLMNYKSWSKTEYFNDFLAKNNLYYSCGIDIHFENKLLGTISLFRSQKDNNFTLTDLIYLELISKQCSNHLHKLFTIENLKNKKTKRKNSLLKIAANRYNLTNREREVLKLLIEGKNNQEIAENLFISVNTIKKHLSNIFNKTEVNNRTELTSMIFKF
ncbi:response regulator transcription factor [Halanaerobium sp. ST460_2HS_T2]|uniref:response regulator transcription factor n=1 Tax=Halanaerobium sp. ST460_2HS_T2 TaxID=2183914 RepID=UPI000DF2D64E|nr:response regulator transcription factor [Halanaerobium sp. ST460_2HS_T2]RCW61190.1 regulatory LuxR family protein [Halanaerobium sp. ST460_2HS_T2]